MNGIFDENCSSIIKYTDHTVTVVGWDIDRITGTEYWIIRNSWGDKWGNHGHIKVKIGGKCTVHFFDYPEVERP